MKELAVEIVGFVGVALTFIITKTKLDDRLIDMLEEKVNKTENKYDDVALDAAPYVLDLVEKALEDKGIGSEETRKALEEVEEQLKGDGTGN